MAASAAPARIPRKQPGPAPSIPIWLDRHGWTSIPRNAFKELGRRLDYLAFRCFGIIYEETLGKPEKPDWASVTEKRLADWTATTPEAVLLALKKLDQTGLIEREKRGRAYVYRPSPDYPERLKAIEVREPKKLPTEGEREERKRVIALKAEMVCPACGAAGAGLTCSACGVTSQVSQVYDLGDGRISTVAPLGAEIIGHAPASNTQSPDWVSGPERAPASSSPAVEPATGPQQNQGHTSEYPNSRLGIVAELKRVLAPYLARPDVLGKIPGGRIFERTLENLAGAPVERLLNLVAAETPQRWRKYGSKLLPCLATDAHETHRQLSEQVVRQQQEAAEFEPTLESVRVAFQFAFGPDWEGHQDRDGFQARFAHLRAECPDLVAQVEAENRSGHADPP